MAILPNSPATGDKLIVAETLTVKAFRNFGEVLAPRDVFGPGDASDMIPVAEGGRTGVTVATFRRLQTPFSFCQLERHQYSKQAFVPLHGQRYLVVVAPNHSQQEPDVDHVREHSLRPADNVSATL